MSKLATAVTLEFLQSMKCISDGINEGGNGGGVWLGKYPIHVIAEVPPLVIPQS